MTDEELMAEILAAQGDKTSRGEALLRGAAQGGTLFYGDEIGGAVRALPNLKVPQDIRTPGPRALAKLYPGVPYAEAASRWFNENRPDQAIISQQDQAQQEQGAAYKQERNAIRAANTKAFDDRPGYYLGGSIAGAAPALIASGGGLGPVLATSAFQGAGASESDSAKGLAVDTALGTAGGLAGRGLGKLAGAGVSRLDRLAGNRLSAAATKAQELAEKKIGKLVGSLRGAYGGNRQNESRAIEVLLRAEQTGSLTAAQAAELAALKASPEWAATIQNVTQNYIDDFPGLANAATASKAAYEQAAATAPQDIAKEAARLASWPEVKAQIGARLQRYGPMAAAGALLGNSLGGGGAAIVGGAAGAAVRPMLHAVRRAWQHPSVQTAAWTPMQRLAQTIASPKVAVPADLSARLAGVAGGLAASPRLMSYADPEAAAQAELDRLMKE